MTLRSSDTVHPITPNSNSLFSFKKQKQEQPLEIIKGVEMLPDIEDWKEISTSTYLEGGLIPTLSKASPFPTDSLSGTRLGARDSAGMTCGLWG